MKRTGFIFRTLMAVIFLGLLAVGGYAIFQAGIAQGYSAAILSEGLEGAKNIVPISGFGHLPYHYGYGFPPFLWGIGMLFKFFFFMLLFGFVFRMLFFRRSWGWHGMRPGMGRCMPPASDKYPSREEWQAHWEKHGWSKPPWMDWGAEPDEPEIKESSPEE